jgi:hypothetical protein
MLADERCSPTLRRQAGALALKPGVSGWNEFWAVTPGPYQVDIASLRGRMKPTLTKVDVTASHEWFRRTDAPVA